MRRLALAATLIVLVLPSAMVPAESRVDMAPEWNMGDRWEYRVTVNGPAQTMFGNLTLEVSAVGPVRLGDRTSDAYTLTSRQTVSGNNVDSITSSITYVSRSDLCVLCVNSTIVTWYGSLNSSAMMELRYNASDGRYRFPLDAGAAWETDYVLTRAVRLDSGLSVENRTIHTSFACEGALNLSVPAGRFRALKVVCCSDASNRTSYWFSGAVRGDVRREDRDGSTGVTTVYDLKSYRRSQGPMFILGTDTGLAIMLGIISAVLAAAALSILWARSRDSSAASPKKEGRGKSL
jgi:hypothetical protein